MRVFVCLFSLLFGLHAWAQEAPSPTSSVQIPLPQATVTQVQEVRPESVSAEFVSESGVTLEALSAGEAGSGYLLYGIPDNGPERPSLVVHLSTKTVGGVALAEVYQAQPSERTVPVTRSGGGLQLSGNARPIMTLKAKDGWWVRGETINYNLDVQIDGPVYAMWGGGYQPDGPIPEERFTRWVAEVELGEPTVRIQVRDIDQDGVPDWDWRSLLPRFIGRGFLRTNYVERKCASPLTTERGLTPLWPFVAREGHFETPMGELRPPIVPDWNIGKVIYFSEVVTARNQNCAYVIYSQFPLKAGELNTLNFEYPFAFYDLSGEGQGYPNLILRTERFPADDPYILEKRRNPLDFMAVRYSWRHGVGDWRWDYKVEVLGFPPYDAETALAGDQFKVDAPSYEDFPSWVTSQAWPVTTFVSTEDTNYRSSEGIYDWPTRDLGDTYVIGWAEDENPRAFRNIRQGLRGEVRYHRALKPELYVSPIDRRAHLVGAERGAWNLGANAAGDELYLVTENLSGSSFLDHWRLETRPLFAPTAYSERALSERVLAERVPPAPLIRAELSQLGLYLLLADADGVTLQRAELPPSLLNVTPPTDKATWEAVQAQLEPFRGTERNPRNLRSWLDAVAAETESATRLSFPTGRVSELQSTPAGYRFVLNVTEGVQGDLQGLTLAALRDLPPGQHVIHYDVAADTWTRTAATPPTLEPTLQAEENVRTLEPLSLALGVRNTGTLDWTGSLTLRAGNAVLATWERRTIPGESSLSEIINWTFDTPGTAEITLEVETGAGKNTRILHRVDVTAAKRVQGVRALILPFSNAALSATSLFAVLALALFGFWRVWRLNEPL